MRRALLVLATAAAALATAATAAAPPATVVPGQLTVGVSLPSEAFQVGVVRGTDVLLARGLEVDLARALATRLGLPRTVFVQSRFDRLYAAGEKPWDVAIAELSITDARRATVDFTRPYMSVDQGVLIAQTVTQAPRTIAALRALRLCALRKSTGADAVTGTVRPTRPVALVGNVSTLMLNLQTGRCDAVVYDAPALGALKSRAPARYGAFAGVLRTGESYGIALRKGSPIRGRVDAALGALLADGTVERLQRKWLTARLESLPVLR
jgi:polar amino acid transport system substrate-binding protein